MRAISGWIVDLAKCGSYGAVLGLTNSTGTFADQYTYSPYGTQTTLTNTTPNYYGYDSGLTIPNTTLIHYGARYYNTTDNQWTQLDPSGQSAGYVYVNDQPLTGTDPSGQCDIFGRIFGGITGLAIFGLGAVSAVPALGDFFGASTLTDVLVGGLAFGPLALGGIGAAITVGYFVGAYD